MKLIDPDILDFLAPGEFIILAMKNSSYEAQFAKFNSEHASRNRGSDEPMMKADVGGSPKFTDPGPKAKSHKLADGLGGLKKVMQGRMDPATKGRNVV